MHINCLQIITLIDNILQVWPVGYECARGEKKANLRRFLGNLKVHLKTKSAPMVSIDLVNHAHFSKDSL